MTWNTWSEFLAMGGYGLYVWGSYAVTFTLIAAEMASLRRRQRVALRDARSLRTNVGTAR